MNATIMSIVQGNSNNVIYSAPLPVYICVLLAVKKGTHERLILVLALPSWPRRALSIIVSLAAIFRRLSTRIVPREPIAT